MSITHSYSVSARTISAGEGTADFIAGNKKADAISITTMDSEWGSTEVTVILKNEFGIRQVIEDIDGSTSGFSISASDIEPDLFANPGSVYMTIEGEASSGAVIKTVPFKLNVLGRNDNWVNFAAPHNSVLSMAGAADLDAATGKSGVPAAATLIGGVNVLYGETDLDDVKTDMAAELSALNTALTAEHTTLKAAIAAAIEALSE